MKKNGFTLIELLGVMVILALLIILVFPSIINSIKNSSEKTDELTLKLLYNAADIYISNHKNAFPKKNGNKYVISLKELVEDDLLASPIKLSNSDEDLTNLKSIQVTYSNDYNYELKDNELVEWFNIKSPDLYNNALVPVVYNGENWEIVSEDSEWYDYENQEWANAVILNDNVSRNVGYELNVETDVKAMFVYIPRYEYKIQGDYGKKGTSISNPGEIDVNFISKEKTVASNGYTISPAFKFGDENIDGIWVGKFEISVINDNRPDVFNCSSESCDPSEDLRILPNVTTLYSGDVFAFFYIVKFMSEEGNGFGLDKANSHMIKNSEWASIAYLSQSKYGKYGNNDYSGINKEIYQNKSYLYITGSSNGTPSSETFNTQCSYYDTTNNCGVGASTTGNITGIYDMSGGALEYVMGNYNNLIGESRFTSLPESKYFDCYTSYENAGVGHGITEISSSSSGSTSWYNDFSIFVTDEKPWFIRGGHYSDGISAGIFGFKNDLGSESWLDPDTNHLHLDNVNSTRVVLVPDI